MVNQPVIQTQWGSFSCNFPQLYHKRLTVLQSVSNPHLYIMYTNSALPMNRKNWLHMLTLHVLPDSICSFILVEWISADQMARTLLCKWNRELATMATGWTINKMCYQINSPREDSVGFSSVLTMSRHFKVDIPKLVSFLGSAFLKTLNTWEENVAWRCKQFIAIKPTEQDPTVWAELELNLFAQHEAIMLKGLKIPLNTFLSSSQTPNCVRKKIKEKLKKKKKTLLCANWTF